MASCLKASWKPRLQSVVLGGVQLIWIIALISEFVNQKEVAAWTYNYSIKAYSWNYSRTFCQKHFTDLVAIQNKNEIAHLNDVIPYFNSYYWIGIRKINNKWTWVGTNKTLTEEAENWADNEPNNKRNNQDCVEIYIKSNSAPGKWNDEPCSKRKRALCYTASCQDMSCNKQGECIETIGNYTCSCYPGFYGPECEYVQECGEFDLPQHVLMNCQHPLGDFSFSSQCSFHCAEGYELNGPSRLECLASGSWTNKPPQCKAVQCQSLGAPIHGTMDCVHPLAAFAYGSRCNFECHLGYQVRGSDTLHCTGSGQWTGPSPTCEAIACEPLETPAHGSMDCSPSTGALEYNSSCAFTCAEGFVLKGNDAVQCIDLGQWTAPAPVCEALQCQDFPVPRKARVTCSDPFGALKYQSVCSFSCDEGSLLVGASAIRCLATGHWSGPLPECQAVTCTSLLSPQNGTMTCIQPPEGSTYKSTCQFICDEGFYLSGPERLDCSPSGHWTGTPPTCEAIKCPGIFAPDQGSLDCSHDNGEFIVGSTCHFSCNKDFELVGSNTVECMASGRWSAPPPTCKGVTSLPSPEVHCPALNTPGQGKMSCRHHLGSFGPNTTCYFGCKTGFTLRGANLLRCRTSGQWTAVTPACRAIKCSELHIDTPVLMNCSNPWGNFSYGSTCTFNCPEGRLLNGSARATCRENGQWSAAMPTCQAGPLTIQEALTYFGGVVASTTGLAVGGTLLALLRKRLRKKDDGKCPLNPHSHLGTYGVFTNAAFDPTP
ncbi:P-selectin isoform X1 [Phodopus roborovskii]|uniref:P-selectin isoform X1 n=1 Tax=Phodopus roborovskii TaxID=109678 RepID=UPI0021E372E4|nr:P-selectin isoform X1 [Phodopus roborovskii]XP_051042094.1 P-selectin isoform X1 [Phodopus roborovskii]